MPRLEDWDEIRNALLKPFHPREVSFRAGATTQGRAMALAFVDVRTVMKRLDDTVGPEGWYFDYDVITAAANLVQVKGRLTVLGITKADAGEAGREDEPLKSAVSDALKRCGVQFGISRFLYELPQLWVPHDGRRFTDQPRIEPRTVLTAALAAGWQGNEDLLLAELKHGNVEAPTPRVEHQAPQRSEPRAEHRGSEDRPRPAPSTEPRPANPPANQAAPAETGEVATGITCSAPGCGKPLTKGQAAVSERAFGGNLLCPYHQRVASKS